MLSVAGRRYRFPASVDEEKRCFLFRMLLCYVAASGKEVEIVMRRTSGVSIPRFRHSGAASDVACELDYFEIPEEIESRRGWIGSAS